MNNFTNSSFTIIRNPFKKFIIAFSLLFTLIFGNISIAQVSITTTTPITQDFNGLSSTGSVTWTNNSTPLVGWYSTVTTLAVNTGSTNSNAVYNCGSTSNSDRALGALSTAVTHNFGVRLKNNNANAITSLTIAFNGEQWRRQAASQTLVFDYQIGTTVTSITTGTWTAVTALDFVSPNIGTAIALDGNLTANRTAKSAVITLTIPAGSEIMLRWTKSGSSSHLLAVDDLSITPVFATSDITSTSTGGNWSDTATWVGGVVPTSADNAVIASGAVVTMDSTTYATRNAGTTTLVNFGGTLATNLNYLNNGTTTVDGSFQLNSGGWVSDAGGTNSLVYGTNGTLIFNNAYTANNGNYWPTTSGPVNVTVNSGSNLTLGYNRTVNGTFQTAAGITLSGATLTLNATCQINSGGFFNNSATYGSSSTLVYNNVTSYGVFNEWTGNSTTAGVGEPQNITLTNSSINLPSTVRSLAGNLTIGTGSTLNLNGAFGADLNIGGNWSNSGIFNPSARSVQFRGTTAQTITGATTFDYININNATGVTLVSPITVNNLLDFTAGNVNLGANDLTIGTSGSITNANATRYVNTSGNGQLKRTVGNSNVFFPVGISTYNPVTLNNSGTLDVYGVKVIDGAFSTPIDNTKIVLRRFRVSEAVAGGSNLAFEATYGSLEQATNYSAGTTPFIGFYNGTTWTQVGATLSGSDPFTASSSANSTPADITVSTGQYFAIGKDNAFLSVADRLVVTSIVPTSPTAGSGFNVTIRSQDAFGAFSNVVANTDFTLSTNGNAGSIGGTITGAITAGTSTVTITGVTLSTAGTGADLTATRTAGDNLVAGTSTAFNVLAAASQLAFVGVPSTGGVGVNLTAFTVEARRPDNTLDNTYTGNITIAKASGTGNLIGTLTVAAVAGVATFNIAQFDAADTYTLTATSGSLTSATSGNIAVSLVPLSLYYEDFGNTATIVIPYTSGTNPTGSVVLNTNLTIPTWNQTSFSQAFAGNPLGCISSTVATGTTNVITSVFNVDPGFVLNPSSLSFDYRSTSTGPNNLVVSISGTGGSTSTSTIALTNNNTFISISPSFLSSIVNLTGTITLTFTLTGSTGGNFRLDNTNLFGIITCIQPTAFAVSGGGAYCIGGSGTDVSVSNSEIGVNYQLKIDGVNSGSPLAGTGTALSFGNQTTVGTYTIEASNTNSPCNLITSMLGSVTISINPLPTLDTITATDACVGEPSTVTLTGLLASTAGSFTYTNSYIPGPTFTVSGTSDASGNFTFDTPNLPAAANGAVITITGGTVTATGCTTSFAGKTVTVVVGKTTTWTTGTPNFWDNGTPTSIDAAVISTNYAESAVLNACSLTVNNNAVVTIPVGTNVNLQGAVNVVSGSFALANTANLNQVRDVNNTGNISVTCTTTPVKRLDYVLWSAPVTGQQLQSFSPGTLADRFYTYNPTTDFYEVVASPSSTNFVEGKGYLIRVPNAHNASTPTSLTRTFTGIPNNGDLNLSVTSGTWNAIGNPYPSTLDADEFITANSLTDALYFWRKVNGAAGTAYATYTLAGGTSGTAPNITAPNVSGTIMTPNGTIAVGQGFLAKATSSTLSFTNAMRNGDANTQFFRVNSIDRSRVWLNLFNNEYFVNQTMLAYMPAATNGIDAAIDGRFFESNIPTQLSSLINGEEFAVQGRPEFTTSDVVALGFKAQTEGNYTIAIDHVDGLFADGQEVFLKDNVTNTVHNLTNAAYSFTASEGATNARFEIVYQSSSTLATENPVLNENTVVIYKQNQDIIVNTGSIEMKNVKVYDIQGRLLVEQEDINATKTKLAVGTTNQVLIVKVTSKDNAVVTKKVIN